MNSLLLFALLFVLHLHAIYASTPLPETERQALVELYEATNGEEWARRDNWLQGDPCLNKWHGITCGEGTPTITRM